MPEVFIILNNVGVIQAEKASYGKAKEIFEKSLLIS